MINVRVRRRNPLTNKEQHNNLPKAAHSFAAVTKTIALGKQVAD
ncbi:MAG: hypothetical protein SCH66_13790 [Methanolobus sp.]|nr:hypothetical protein [Methanolobus sp.]